MYDNKIYKHKLTQIRQYYNRVCVQDAECQQLKRHFMLAFYQANNNYQVDYRQFMDQAMMIVGDPPNNCDQQQAQLVSFERFHEIYSLVYKLCRRLHTNAIHSIWIVCCETVLEEWSAHLTRYFNVDQLNFILQCWNRYQNANNLINTLTLYAQNKLFQTHRPGRIKSQINDICCHIFVERFFANNHGHQHQSTKLDQTTVNSTSSPNRITSECSQNETDRCQDGGLFCSIIEVINRCNDLTTLSGPYQAMAPIDFQFRHRCMETVKDTLALLEYVDSRSHIVYYRIFAFPYLKAIQRQYQQRSSAQIQQFDGHIVDYLRNVELAIDQEISLANLYSFAAPFVRMIAKLLYHELITRHQTTICAFNSFEQLINSENWTHLHYLYNMVMYNSDAVKLLATNLETYLKARLATIRLMDWKNNRYTQHGAATFVQNCNYLMEHWNSVVMNTFNNDKIIGQSVTSSIGHYLNSNAVFIPIVALYVHVVSMANCPASLLAIGADSPADHTANNTSNNNQKPINNPDSVALERQAAISNAFKLLSFVDDKSAVIQFSHHFLCHRILYELSYSIDQDISAISSKLDSLNVDVPFSVKLLLKDYNSSIQSLNKSIDFNVPDFEVKLLNSSLWNLEKSPTYFRLPKQFLESFNLFRRKYRAKDPKKSVKLNQNYGSAKMVVNLVGNQASPFHFVVTLRQAIILLVFNRSEPISFQQISTLTTMDYESLVQCMKTFHQYNLITICSAQCSNGTLDWTNSSFQINDQFQFNNGMEGTETKPINWIRLQYESADYNLEQLMRHCLESSRQNGPGGAGGGGQGGGPPSTTTVEANQSGKNIRLEAAIIRTMKREKVVLDLNLLHQLVMETIGNRQMASPSPPGGTSSSSSTNSASNSTSDSTSNSGTTNNNNQNANTRKPFVLPISELRQIVISLEKRGYLRILDNETILYEP